MIARRNIWVLLVLLSGWLPSFGQDTLVFTADSTMRDAMVANGGVENQNYGSQSEMYVFHQMNGQIPMVFRTFMYYDVSNIPQEAIIVDATLSLIPKQVNNTKDHPIYIERVDNETWYEDTITWNNQPDVVTADQLSFTHSQTTGTTLQEFDVTDHVQHMVNHPNLNHGWRIRLQDESDTTDFGIVYNSSEANNSSKRPYLTVTYVMPIEMESEIIHCTSGNDDGELTVTVSGGSTYGNSNFFFYKTNRDTTQSGTATLQNYEVIGNFDYDTITKKATVENLEPGIYALRVLDDTYYANSNPRLAFFKHFLVGREGEVTSGILIPNDAYQDNVAIQYDKPTNTSPLDRANTNYASSNYILRVADSPNNYEFASLMRYRIDFDDRLEFSKAEIQIDAYTQFYRHNNSSNAVNFSRTTSDWDEHTVTWNTRPAIDSSSSITIPATTTIGYDPVHDRDTVSILPFVDYWLENPEENFGFEMALQTYGATQYARRSYKGQANNVNFIEFEFSVIPFVETAFDDTTNTGSLTVNAPDGTLPYTYLIDTDSLGTLADLWTEIGDSTLIDSVDFFTGNISSRQYTFTDLPSGPYFIAVYDSNGTKILDGQGVVNTDVAFYNDTLLDLSLSNQISRTTGASINGSGRLFAELMSDASWGGTRFSVDTLGDFFIGFNKSTDATAANATDLEFGIKITSQGAYQIVENNVLLTTGSTTILADDEIVLLRDQEDYVAFINDTEVYRDTISGLKGEDASFDVVLTDGVSVLRLENYYGEFQRPAPGMNIGYPECGSFVGSLTVTSGVGGSIVSCTLENNDGVSPNPGGLAAGGNYVFSEIPIGTYTLTVNYSVAPMGDEPGYSYIISEQIAIGYVVEWENMAGNFVTPLNTIRKGPGPMIPSGWATANSTNRTVNDYPNWLQFEVDLSMGYFMTTSNREKLMLRNQEGESIYMLETALFPGSAMAYRGESGYVGSSLVAGPNGVWRIDQEEETYDLFKENLSISSVTVDAEAVPPVYEIAIEQNGTAQYIKTIASFCTFAKNDFLAKTKLTTDGGYYEPIDDVLKFQYTGEYNSSGLIYSLTSQTGAVIGGAFYTIEALPDLTDDTKKNADNRYQITFTGLSSGFYLLKVTNVKGEDHFIRIKL